MKIKDQMQAALDQTPGLDIVGLGDLSSGLILNWTAKAQHPREVLDLLGERAVTAQDLLRDLPLPTGAEAEVFGLTILRFSETGTEIFARGEPGSEDVICAVCRPGAPLGPALSEVTGLARSIAGGS